nr:CHAT domain-containing protein [bacterium]
MLESIMLGIIANLLYDLTKGQGRLADIGKYLDDKVLSKLAELNEPTAKVFQEARHQELIAKLETYQTDKKKQSLIALGQEFGRILSLPGNEALQEGISIIWENFESQDSILLAEMLVSGFASLKMEISEMKDLLEEGKAQRLALNAPTIEVHLEKLYSKNDGHVYRSRVLTVDRKEIVTNEFEYHPGHLVHLEVGRYFEKEIGRKEPDVLRNLEINGVSVNREQSLINYGQRLYGYLFGDGNDLSSFLKYDESYRNGACLNICATSEAAELLCLPWEYLHDGEQALALSGKFFIQRTPVGLGEIEMPSLPQPLKILVVVSSPIDAPELNTEKEIAVIQDALDDAVRLGSVKIDFLEEATLENLRLALRNEEEEYHVLHYTGHGGWDAEEKSGLLLLEKDDGTSKATTVADLQTAFLGASALRLVVLSGCMTAKTSEQDAFSGMATGLLQNELPAVMAMQFPILDESAIELARAFYTSLGKGKGVEEAIFLARLAMKDREDGPETDWGIPALYLRTSGMRLIDPSVKPKDVEPEPLKNYGLPLPKWFVGRKLERRRIRAALRDKDKTVVYVRGLGGIGKSSVAAKILERPGVEIDGSLVISCDRENLTFGEVLQKLANFIQGRGVSGHAEAAQILLDSRKDISERVFQMAELISSRRYLFVFDNFETLMESKSADVAAGSVLPCRHRGTTL